MIQLWQIFGKVAYVITFPAIVFYAAISRPRTRVLILVGDEVLVVQNWLGLGHWSLPGGGAHKGEDPIDAALREVKEELAIVLEKQAIIKLGYHASTETKLLKSKYELFAVQLNEKPGLTLQQHEIMGAKWLNANELHAENKLAATTRDSVATWMKYQNLV